MSLYIVLVGPYNVDQAVLELMTILLLQSSKEWGYKTFQHIK